MIFIFFLFLIFLFFFFFLDIDKSSQLSEDILQEFLDLASLSGSYADSELKIQASYNRHGPKSIAYGGDWCHLQDFSQFYANQPREILPTSLIQSASFYNKRVDLWYPSKS